MVLVRDNNGIGKAIIVFGWQLSSRRSFAVNCVFNLWNVFFLANFCQFPFIF